MFENGPRLKNVKQSHAIASEAAARQHLRTQRETYSGLATTIHDGVYGQRCLMRLAALPSMSHTSFMDDV